MKICRLILLCVILLSSISIYAQKSPFKNEKRIYLWDVTLSMKGYLGKTPNIYEKVITALEKDINSIIDEQTEIWVLPFQTTILEKWNAKATQAGKAALITQIRNFSNEQVTNTNITVPMKDIMNTLIDTEKRNVIILLTDGEQNDKEYPLFTLLDIIHKWCDFAERNDAHAFYVMLTHFATNNELIKAIDGTCRMHKVLPSNDGVIDVNFVELLPQNNLKYNIKDDAGKKLTIKVDCKKKVAIPDGLMLHCYCAPNPYIEINGSASINNGMIELDLKQKQSYDSLKQMLPKDTNEKITLYLEVEDKITYSKVLLLSNECCLELINKPEKILKIYVKN